MCYIYKTVFKMISVINIKKLNNKFLFISTVYKSFVEISSSFLQQLSSQTIKKSMCFFLVTFRLEIKRNLSVYMVIVEKSRWHVITHSVQKDPLHYYYFLVCSSTSRYNKLTINRRSILVTKVVFANLGEGSLAVGRLNSTSPRKQPLLNCDSVKTPGYFQ